MSTPDKTILNALLARAEETGRISGLLTAEEITRLAEIRQAVDRRQPEEAAPADAPTVAELEPHATRRPEVLVDLADDAGTPPEVPSTEWLAEAHGIVGQLVAQWEKGAMTSDAAMMAIFDVVAPDA
jgi:hypothetical protein